MKQFKNKLLIVGFDFSMCTEGDAWTLSAMTSKHKMAANSVDTFVQRLLGEMAVCYVNVYILQKEAS